jgi:dihydroorotate dehydrogenase (NAD+) catalytic subunit
MSIDPVTRTSRIANTTGGLSGPAVKPVAVRQVYQVAQAVSIPVIGIGGIFGLNDALEFFMAGATAVEMGTVCFSHPSAPIQLIDDLQAWLDAHRCDSIMDIVGVANPRFAGTKGA